MAGTADPSSAGQTGPMSRRPARRTRLGGRPVFNPVPIEIGAAAQPVDAGATAAPAVIRIPPDVMPRLLRTQAAYRFLLTNGFSGADAAGLIGYVVGLPQGESRWTLSQVNRLLYLRSLYSNSDWGEVERRPA